MESSSGTGAALDATISTDPADAEQAQAAADQREAALAALRDKVERQKQHLAGAEAALAQAEKEGV